MVYKLTGLWVFTFMREGKMKARTAIIVLAILFISLVLSVYFSPYQSCMREYNEEGVNAKARSREMTLD